MGRYYKLTKKVSKEVLSEIIREMKEIDDISEVEITEDGTLMKVVTKDDKFEDVMSRAINICRRVGSGLEISFARFVY